ncbi:MAG TPA: hypothetical protein VLF88_02585 [Candidatus Babeliales bacterium]|nr:hypothetical protein [Candidatus Babeliales bacterium]
MEQNENSPWKYKADDGREPDESARPDSKDSSNDSHSSHKSIAWEAPEFIDHPHGPGWYSALAASTAALAAIAYLAKDIVAGVIIIAVGIIVGVFVRQKPTDAKYEINPSGLSINGKQYFFGNYKSFTIVSEGSLSSINLFPLKRFTPPLSAYFKSGEEKRIVDTIGNYLPYEDRKLDSVDRLTRRLRL